MNKKIIFFDIDGTILSHRTHSISDSTRDAIKQAQTNGHLAYINTGRTISAIEPLITDVGFDGFVCGCGTYISHKDTVLLQATIPHETIQMLLMDLRRYQIEAILEGSKALYFDNNTNSPRLKRLKESQEIHNFDIRSWEDPELAFDKFCIWPNHDEGMQAFYKKYQPMFEFIDRGGNLYEVVPKGYSKASGIEYLIKYLGILYENTYAIGDSTNDLSMLKYAKYSIAMGNAPTEIKSLVNFVTKDVDDEGISHALKHFTII